MSKNIEKYLNAEKIDISEWEKIASAALKDLSLEDLNKEIDKDLKIKPLYTLDDEEDDYSHSLRRGLKSDINEFMPWYICTTVDHHNDPKILNGRILGELERGSNSIELSFFETNTLNKILNNVDLSIAPVFIRDINYSKEKLLNYIDFLRNKNKDVMGGYEVDPFASNLWLEEFSKNSNNEIINYKEIKAFNDKINDEFKNINLVNFDGSLWNELGANTSEEIELLALSFLKFHEKHQNKNQDIKPVNITLSSNTDFFTSISKIRALRIIFNNIFKHLNFNGKLNITSRSSSNILFEKDPWVNQLRITTAALASAIGGSDKIICNNITHKLGQAPDFIKRLTRNTHIILQEESRISRVQDPSGGSFYIEKLTNNIARNVWKNLKEKEKNGGILSLIKSKDFRNSLKNSRNEYKNNILEKKLIKVGENSYKDPDSNPINVKPFENNNI
tara:strand:- start:224 stop:1567 length:1344 start_codon:yes stop_codon:yes gene_type:complete